MFNTGSTPTTTVNPTTDAGITGIKTAQTSSAGGAPSNPSSFKLTDGGYVAIACLSGLILADTRVGPLIGGILGIALIYQLTLLVQHK